MLSTWCPPGSKVKVTTPPEGVIWKARDLWSAPVERSSHGLQARKCNRLCSLRQGLAAGILLSAAAALPPSATSWRQLKCCPGCAELVSRLELVFRGA